MSAEYSPIPPGGNPAGAQGPCSNTGQNLSRSPRRADGRKPRIPKGAPGSGALVDYLSLTVPRVSDWIADIGEEDFALKVVASIFGRGANLHATEFTDAGFQGYTHSALILGPGGEVVGKLGIGGNNDTLHVSLTGAGCAHVPDWPRVARGCAVVAAKITRCDLAFDDYRGEFFCPRTMYAQVMDGKLRIRAAGPGKPPKCRFVDDMGHGTGVTLYAGAKGNKELCVYEKGKEQGDPSSPWVRVEVRFYAKHADLPNIMLQDPLPYLRAAYNVCEAIPANVTERLKTKRAKVSASAVAWVRWMQTQVGGSIHLLQRALGDETGAYLANAIARDSTPARFRQFDAASIIEHIREGLHVGCGDPVGALA